MIIYHPPWRNWLARETVNLEVDGSSPSGGAFSFCFSPFLLWLCSPSRLRGTVTMCFFKVTLPTDVVRLIFFPLGCWIR